MIDTHSVRKSGTLRESDVLEAPHTRGTTEEPESPSGPTPDDVLLSSAGDVQFVERTYETYDVVATRVYVSGWGDYDDMDEDEQDAALRAMTMARLDSELDDEPDFDPDV